MTRVQPSTAHEWSTPRQAMALFVRGATARVAGKVALIVGTILSAVNQGSVIWAGHATAVTWLRVAVNYLTPFVVASIGYLAARRQPPGTDVDGTARRRTSPDESLAGPGRTRAGHRVSEHEGSSGAAADDSSGEERRA